MSHGGEVSPQFPLKLAGWADYCCHLAGFFAGISRHKREPRGGFDSIKLDTGDSLAPPFRQLQDG